MTHKLKKNVIEKKRFSNMKNFTIFFFFKYIYGLANLSSQICVSGFHDCLTRKTQQIPFESVAAL